MTQQPDWSLRKRWIHGCVALLLMTPHLLGGTGLFVADYLRQYVHNIWFMPPAWAPWVGGGLMVCHALAVLGTVVGWGRVSKGFALGSLLLAGCWVVWWAYDLNQLYGEMSRYPPDLATPVAVLMTARMLGLSSWSFLFTAVAWKSRMATVLASIGVACVMTTWLAIRLYCSKALFGLYILWDATQIAFLVYLLASVPALLGAIVAVWPSKSGSVGAET